MQVLKELGLSLEPFISSDTAFVLDSWLRSYAPSGLDDDLSKARYYRNQRARAMRCIESGSVVMAVLPGHQLAGWVCYGPGLLHYVYVKRLFRGQGIGTALVEQAAPEAYTHDSQQWQGLLRSLPNAMVHRPVDVSGRVEPVRAAGVLEPEKVDATQDR